jgi:CelD/BcsL family acetyltransferase involved in cellulose biosynthesis
MEPTFELKDNENTSILLYSTFNDELKLKWSGLEKLCNGYIYQRYSWNFYWFQIFNTLYDFRIVVVEEDEIPVAIFPFCINNNGIHKILQFIGGEQADYLTPILSDYYVLSIKTWETVLRKIDRDYDLIIMDKIPEFIYGKKNAFLNVIKTSYSGLSFGIELPESYVDFENSLKRNFRNDNKRNLKRLKELGNIEFRKISANSDDHQDFDFFIEKSIEQKSRRIKNYLGNRVFENDYTQEFYRKSYLISDPDFHLDYTILTLNSDKVLATHWGFYDSDRYYFLIPTMEGKEYYKYSCGKILIDFLINFSIRKSIRFFDFTIGDENYKKDWCNIQFPIFSYKKSKSLKGLLYMSYLNSVDFLKKNKYAKSTWRSLKSHIVNTRKRR